VKLIFFLQDGLADIFLDGIAARNRALNGDVVVVKVLPPEQWKVLHQNGHIINTAVYW